MQIFMTGASGQVGQILSTLPHQIVAYDRQPSPEGIQYFHWVQGDLGDQKTLQSALAGSNVLIHLAAQSKKFATWEKVIADNIAATQTLFEMASKSGIRRVIFASTHHVVGMYELDNAPQIYEIGHGIMIDHQSPVRPDSYYATSKVFGEALGRYYVDNGLFDYFYALRIGAVVAEDHPYAYAERGVAAGKWSRQSTEYEHNAKRLKALWQSHRDLQTLVNLLLAYEEPFDTFYGVSNNDRRWLDIQHAKQQLGYVPQDNAEDWHEPPTKSATS